MIENIKNEAIEIIELIEFVKKEYGYTDKNAIKIVELSYKSNCETSIELTLSELVDSIKHIEFVNKEPNTQAGYELDMFVYENAERIKDALKGLAKIK